MNTESKHKKAERLYAALPVTFSQQLWLGLHPNKKMSKWRLFFTYSLLADQCQNSSGWQLAESMYNVVQKRTKEVVSGANYFSISCDEVTTVDNQSWISIHAYVLIDWERVPLLLTLERLTDGATAPEITKVIVRSINRDGGLNKQDIQEKLLCFGSDGASVLQGKRTGATIQLQGLHAPHCVGMHCVAHWTDLVVEVLSDFEMISTIEKLLKKLHSYFSKNPKRHLELEKLSELLNSKGGKILNNVKTRWISMLSPLRRVLSEYRVLLIKMYGDMFVKTTIKGARANFERLADVNTLLWLAALLPLLQIVKNLIVFAQSQNVYVCDFTRALTICQQDIHVAYIDGEMAFKSDAFSQLNSIFEMNNNHVRLRWHPDLNDGEEHLVFEAHQETLAGSHLNATCFNASTGIQGFVTHELWEVVKTKVKRDVQEAATKIMMELSNRFPPSHIMDALCIVYPQFWIADVNERQLQHHLGVIKNVFGQPKEMETEVNRWEWTRELVSPGALDKQLECFRIAMMNNSLHAMRAIDPHIHPMTKLWRNLSLSPMLPRVFPEFFKLAEIGMIMVLGSVEDERTFSNVSFLKSKIRNRLTEHLALCATMFAQKYFTIKTMPYKEAIEDWRLTKSKRGRYQENL